MKVIALLLALFALTGFTTALLTQPQDTEKSRQRKLLLKQLKANGVKDPRKAFLTFTWNANEQRYVQNERMREIMKNTMKELMEKYQFEAHLD